MSIVLLSLLAITSAYAESTPNHKEADPSAKSQTQLTDYTKFKLGQVANDKFNALIQGWSIQNQNTHPSEQRIRLRRAELKLSGKIANQPKYFFMIDPAKLIPPPNGKSISADNMIQDFGLAYGFTEELELTAGQFKTPSAAEGLDSSSDLPLPERSLLGRTLGDKRETGLKLAYKTASWNLSSMISSGRSVSGKGTGMFNDLTARFEITAVENLSLGAFVVMGKEFSYSKKGRWGTNARFTLGQAALRAEYAQAKDGATQSRGITTEIGYWITPELQPVARFESFTPSQIAGITGKAQTIGVNYYLRDYLAKLQLAGSAMQNLSASNGSPSFSKGANNKTLVLAVQASI